MTPQTLSASLISAAREQPATYREACRMMMGERDDMATDVGVLALLMIPTLARMARARRRSDPRD